MNIIKSLTIIFFSLFIFACSSSGSDSSPPSVTAPSSLTGKTYNMTISSGSGLFATTGTYTVSFSNLQDIYVVLGDGVNVADSAGTYAYTASGNQGLASIVDSLLSTGAFVFNFTTATSGTFQVTAISDPNSAQSGTFTE